jgi:hypothetical protein
MRRPVKITTPFPTVQEIAKSHGVPKREAKMLSEAVKRSFETGVFSLPGVARTARVGKLKTGDNGSRGVDRRTPVQNRSRSRKKS